MADEEHMKILEKGSKPWNAWRMENPEIKPDLHEANFSRAYLSGVDLSSAHLRLANLSGAILRDSDLTAAVLRGARLSNADLHDAKLTRADLTAAVLESAHLHGANLRGAKLRLARLSLANLRGADFGNAVLTSADLSNANLRGANLHGADLSAAILYGANLSSADLSSAYLHDAILAHSVLGSLDLRETIGLEEVHHNGSSEISTSTLAKSKGKTPEFFLKGCGLFDWEIAAAKLHDPNLTSEQVIDLTYEIARIKAESPIQVNPIFISYSRKDSEFVDVIEDLLDEKRIRYWRDTRHATSGPLEEIVDRAMQHGRIVLLILSKDSVNSDWVEWEVMRARELAKKSGEHVLCPIAIDNAWETCPWERKLRAQVEKYNILDFSDWNDKDCLATEFEKLIKGLGIYYPKDVATP